MDKLQNLEREAKEVSKKLHDFLRETANILNEPAEKLSLMLDIWGHWDAVVPIYRLYRLVPGTRIHPPEDILLFSADSLEELTKKVEELAEYKEKKAHLT